MLIDHEFLLSLLEKAKASPRLRANYDLRTTDADTSQRMLNALMPGTEVPIHRHRKSTETVALLQGSVTEVFYDDNGAECARFNLDPRKGAFALQIPAGQWHTLIALEPSVILEAKDGSYEPLSPRDTLAASPRR